MIEFIALAEQCAPAIDKNVTLSIVKKESAFNPFAIGVNKGGKKLARQPKDYGTAVVTAQKLINEGYNIDMGYAQINSANLKRLRLSVSQVFDPCNNLKAMQYILSECYSRAGNYQVNMKLSRAFSCYNTGNHTKGFSNGYVNSVNKHLINFTSNVYGKQNTYSVKSINGMGGNELASHANSLLNENNSGVSENISLGNDNSNVGFVSIVNKEDQALLTQESSKTNNGFNDIFRTSKGDIFSKSKRDIFQ